ncbi:MAG: molybdopterin-binding protein [Actinomycetota bacterium]|nr:molybdopterin-binding protein [Actinomycetota bacterium]
MVELGPQQAKVLTVSDGVESGSVDLSGAALEDRLGEVGFDVIERRVVPDVVEDVSNALSYMAYGFNGLIVTTGGTGFGPRDITPEATNRILDRAAPGLADAIRAIGPLGRLSRSTAGIRGAALILNVAGDPVGAVAMLDAVIDVVPEALAVLGGRTSHSDVRGS